MKPKTVTDVYEIPRDPEDELTKLIEEAEKAEFAAVQRLRNAGSKHLGTAIHANSKRVRLTIKSKPAA